MNSSFSAAIQQFSSGQYSQAEQTCSNILAQNPYHPDALHMLGLILHQKGDRAQSLKLLIRSLECDSTNAAHWNNLGVAQTAAGNFHDAVTAYERAIRLRADYADAYNNLGVALEQLGDLERPVDCYEKAIRFRPGFAEAHNNQGNLFRIQGRTEAAIKSYEQALRIKPSYSEAFNNLGIALQERKEYERAMECYRQALRLNPGYTDASNNLATAYKEQGMLEQAIGQYRDTLNRQNDHALSYFNLSQFVAEGRYEFSPPELEHIKALAAQPRPAFERSLFLFTVATAIDKQGNVDEAFHYFKMANAERLRYYQNRNQAFDQQKHAALIDRVIKTFDRDFFQKVKGWGVETDLPIFVIGMPRSGSTLVEQILSSHPDIFGAGELGEIPRLISEEAKQHGSNDLYNDPSPFMNQNKVRAMADEYLNRLVRLGGAVHRVTVKTLENFLHLGVVASFFPNTRIIHCQREPLDIALSCYFQNFQTLDFTWSMEDIAFYYQEYERLMAHWREVLPLPILDIRYEDVIANQEAETRKMLEFCGLEWDKRCLSFFNNRRPVRTASTLQVRKPISTKAVGRWERYREHIGPLIDALGLPASATPDDASPATTRQRQRTRA